MKLLILNTGGSSLKYKLYAMPDETVLARGDVDRLGTGRAVLTHRVGDGEPLSEQAPIPDHLTGIRRVLELLTAPGGPLGSLAELSAVAHKLPHGGEVSGARLIDAGVIAALERYARVVPVHNPPALTAIRALAELLPDTPQCGTFETFFHAGQPPASYRYALPERWYSEHGIRRYGFHSCAHSYVARRIRDLLGPARARRIINCHLGSGTSVCGILDGRSVEISSAFTPQSGTPMSTRSGDFDPFVLTYLLENSDLGLAELNAALTRESGLAGLSGVGGDLRDVEEAADAGSAPARLAIDVFVKAVHRWVGAALIACGGVDVLSFSGGIGENDSRLRAAVADGLGWLGLKLDTERNAVRGEAVLSADDSAVVAMSVLVDEEIVVARDAAAVLREKGLDR